MPNCRSKQGTENQRLRQREHQECASLHGAKRIKTAYIPESCRNFITEYIAQAEKSERGAPYRPPTESASQREMRERHDQARRKLNDQNAESQQFRESVAARHNQQLKRKRAA